MRLALKSKPLSLAFSNEGLGKVLKKSELFEINKLWFEFNNYHIYINNELCKRKGIYGKVNERTD